MELAIFARKENLPVVLEWGRGEAYSFTEHISSNSLLLFATSGLLNEVSESAINSVRWNLTAVLECTATSCVNRVNYTCSSNSRKYRGALTAEQR